jgi:hypothetical protein
VSDDKQVRKQRRRRSESFVTDPHFYEVTITLTRFPKQKPLEGSRVGTVLSTYTLSHDDYAAAEMIESMARGSAIAEKLAIAELKAAL